MMNTSVSAAASSQDALERSSILVDRAIQNDSNYLDLSDILQVPKHNVPSSSGLHDFDYPSLSDPKIGLTSVKEIANIKKVPLPAELVEQFGHMQCNCLMGLFPEISRAWLSIDSDIFVWNFEDGSDLAYFDGLSETILSAGLVSPKANIFQPHITKLLCLTTPVDIVLLGVSFSKPFEDGCSSGEMHLLSEPLFSIPTDNVNIMSIQGADNGRIFMAGKDGNLYELHYQAEDGWFSRRCRKINHSMSAISFMVPSFLNFTFVEDDPLIQISIDNSRNILYTRSEKGAIQVFDMGWDGFSMTRVAAISPQSITHQACQIARTIEKSNYKTVIHISSISKLESVNLHLVAVTNTGVRLYFTTNSFAKHRYRPCMLSLVHVRLPPGFSASSAIQRPNKVHSAHHNRGTLILAASQSEDSDMLWMMGPDCFPFQKILMETHEQIPIDGHTWALAEIPTNNESYDSGSDGPLQKAAPPLVVTQHMAQPQRFVLINSQGSYLMNKQSPAEQLRDLLLYHNGPDADEVQAFFKLHKEDQACATCLILACSSLNLANKMVSEWATRAFFLFGGDAELSSLPPSNIGALSPGPHGNVTTGLPGFSSPQTGFHPNQVSTPYPGSFDQSSIIISPQDIIHSGKHNGLCLYLGRLLRPIWENRMVSDFPVQADQNLFASRFSSVHLSWFLEQIIALKCFLDENSQAMSHLAAEGFMGGDVQRGVGRMDMCMDEQTRKRNRAAAVAQEKASLQNIQQLVNRICESLGLWKLLCDHQFHVIVSGLTKDQENALKQMSFRYFVTNGKDMAGALIQCLINRYLDDNAATDAISTRLREVCPTLYSQEDAICSKANELLQAAKGKKHNEERDRQLKEALQLYKKISLHLDLPTVCGQFAAARHFIGIVDLALTAAGSRDQQGLALHFYKNGEPQEDQQGYQAYNIRKDCYVCISEMLQFLLSTSMSLPQAPSIPNKPGPAPAPDPNTLTRADAELFTEQVFQLCLKSDDEMFHVFLYDWLVSRHLTEKLLEIQSPYLESYLKRSASQQPDNLAVLDLLWRYYEKIHNFSAAAKILAKLADRHSTELNLQHRIEYLSRATMSAKSATTTGALASEGEFLHELEEKMEVARLQMQILDAMKGLTQQDPHIKDSINALNAQLMDISKLYGDYAETYDLSECKLAVVHCGGYYDPTLVESLWRDIIEKELSSTVSSPPATRMTTLKNKLITLGKKYAGTDRYFPLAFLVRFLERISCELGFDPSFVFQTMLTIGAELPKLHEIYDRLFKSKEPFWQQMRQPYYLLVVISQLQKTFTDNPSLVPPFERRAFIVTCHDAVTNYLVELQASDNADASLRTLMHDFKQLQAKIDRLQ